MCYNANSMKKTSSMSKDGNNVSKSRFGCYFCRGLISKTSKFFFETYGLFMVREKVDEVLLLI